MWNEIVANIKDFFNQPVTIIGFSVLFLLIFILVIFSKTSLGKRVLQKLTAAIAQLVSQFNAFKSEVTVKLDEGLKKYEEEKKLIEAKVAVLEKVCLIIAENTHNAKVKEAMEECKKELSICKTSYEELVEERVLSAKEKYEAEAKEKLKSYEDYFKSQKSHLDELVAEAEKASQIAQNHVNSLIEESIEKVEVEKEHLIDTIEEVKEVIEEEVENGKEAINTTREEEKTI